MAASEQILEQFHTGTLQYKKESEICHLLGVSSRGERAQLRRLLRALEQEGQIVRDERGRCVTPEKLGLVRGTLQASERGFAFLLRPEGDLFIPARSRGGALHGDEVFARIVGGSRGDEAAVYSVIRRGMRRIVGVYERGRRGGVVRPDERRFCNEVRIVGGERAASGEKVSVRIVAYPDDGLPEGEIEKIIGRDGDLQTEEDAILCTHELPEEFPQKALAEAAKAAKQPVVPDGRRDFRGDIVITIDGDDSRDFDDAISVRKEGDKFVLGVHIADVSHYVARGGALDKEAFRRGTSVYLPDRVIPMLPAELSDDICSLREGEDRYTLSGVMTVDGEGRVCGKEIAPGIICSRNRMTYGKVTGILEGDAVLCAQYVHLIPMLRDAKELAEILIARRAGRGGLDLDIPEAQIGVAGGEVTLQVRERSISHRMIEAFMVLANEAVATYLQERGAPCLYRVHEKPSEERAAAFRDYLQGLGIRCNFRPESVKPTDYAAVLRAVEGEARGTVVKNVMLRSMAKAAYGAENVGHFGLASDCYCHFTSPIRRYPDLLVHRLVKMVWEGRAKKKKKSFSNFVRIAADSCSQTERRAVETERDVDELYKVWYMRGQLGETFDGVVSGVTSFGIFVELENTVEGAIRLEDLPSDEYTFDEAHMILRGKRRSFRMGDEVRIVVVACDVGARRCRFVLTEGK